MRLGIVSISLMSCNIGIVLQVFVPVEHTADTVQARQLSERSIADTSRGCSVLTHRIELTALLIDGLLRCGNLCLSSAARFTGRVNRSSNTH
jgi:hypothetical protein